MTYKEAEDQLHFLRNHLSNFKDVDKEVLDALTMAMRELRNAQYRELIRDLRICSSPRNCDQCSMMNNSKGCDRLEEDAADAIEELLFR